MKTLLTTFFFLLSITLTAQSVTQPAFIKDVQLQNGNILLVLDYVDLKMTGNLNDFKIINNNSKLRSFTLADNCHFINCNADRNITKKNLYLKKDRIITKGKKEVLVFVIIENNRIIDLNIECVN